MFPTCRVSFNGLKADSRYAVLMDIVPVDNKRYRYAYHRSCWLVAGKADPPAPARLYVHPDSPFTGEQLRKQVVSFEKVKLTNNDMDRHGHVSSLFLSFFFFFSLLFFFSFLFQGREPLFTPPPRSLSSGSICGARVRCEIERVLMVDFVLRSFDPP